MCTNYYYVICGSFAVSLNVRGVTIEITTGHSQILHTCHLSISDFIKYMNRQYRRVNVSY